MRTAERVPGSCWIEKNWPRLTALPHPSEEWEVRDVGGIDKEMVSKLTESDIIRVSGMVEHGSRLYTRKWRTDPDAYERIQEHVENYGGPRMPCCGAPLHIQHSTGGFACKYCEAVNPRSAMQEARA